MRRFVAIAVAAAACGHAADVSTGGGEPTPTGGSGGEAGRAEAGRGGAGGAGGTAGSGVAGAMMPAAAGAPMDASTSGAAGAPLAGAPAADGGVMAAGCAAPAVCEGFESAAVGAPPPAPFTVTLDALTPRNTVAVDDAHVFAGKRAVKIHVAGGTMRTAQISLRGGDLFPPQGRSKVWGRIMLWMDALPNTNTHWSNVEGFGYVTSKPGVTAYVRYGGQFQRTMANYDTASPSDLRTDCAKRSPQRQLPTKRWICYEWMFDAAHDEMRLWLDGAPIEELTVQGSGDACLGNSFNGHWYLPSFRLMGLGWRNYQDMGPIDLWIDDAGVGPERLGCPAR